MVFEKTLVLSSAPARIATSTNKPEDFTVQMRPTLNLDGSKKYKVGLLSVFGSYSWHNVEAQYGNNTIKYSVDTGATWKTVVLSDGVYSYTDMNNYLHNAMFDNGDYTVVSGINSFAIDISFDLSTFLVSITITDPTYQVDLVSQAFGDLIGFDVDTPLTATTTGDRLPDVTRSVDTILVHSSLVSDSNVNGQNSDVIFSYSTSTLLRSYSYSFEPYNIQFNPLSGNNISSIRMHITDVFNRTIDLNGIDMSYNLIIREDI